VKREMEGREKFEKARKKEVRKNVQKARERQKEKKSTSNAFHSDSCTILSSLSLTVLAGN
jgi:hypothetical protein